LLVDLVSARIQQRFRAFSVIAHRVSGPRPCRADGESTVFTGDVHIRAEAAASRSARLPGTARGSGCGGPSRAGAARPLTVPCTFSSALPDAAPVWPLHGDVLAGTSAQQDTAHGPAKAARVFHLQGHGGVGIGAAEQVTINLGGARLAARSAYLQQVRRAAKWGTASDYLVGWSVSCCLYGLAPSAAGA
jgi:hypothetical protein